MSTDTIPAAPPAPLLQRLTAAIADPGAFAGRRLHPSWGEGEPGYAVEPESIAQWGARAVAAVITEALALPPCHVTGMHAPEHHLRSTCSFQLQAIAEELMGQLGLTAQTLPRRLHGSCYWCHGVPALEKDRERQRATHRWAGVEIPAELAAEGKPGH